MNTTLNIASLFYLSLIVSFVISYVDWKSGVELWKATFIRWGKLLGGLAGVILVVQTLTWIGS